MTRRFLTLIFAFAASSVSAVDAPWHQSAISETPAYCKGFVIGGLASYEVAGVHRTDLWLAWNHVIRSGALHDDATKGEYQAGWAQFQDIQDIAGAESVMKKADGECGLGRTGRQITGW